MASNLARRFRGKRKSTRANNLMRDCFNQPYLFFLCVRLHWIAGNSIEIDIERQ
jgi:hypothetical protein